MFNILKSDLKLSSNLMYLFNVKRGFSGLGINSGKDLVIINNKSIIIKLSFQ